MAKQAPLRAKEKLAFLLAFIPYLRDRDVVTVQEAAADFGMTVDQIKAAVGLIWASGVPGESGAYLPNDLFDFSSNALDHDEIELTHQVAIDNAPRFTAQEASALIAGLQYLSALPESADSLALGQLMAKLALGSTGTPNTLAIGAAQPNATVTLAMEAIENKVQVEFDYLSANGAREHRTVDPLRIASLNSSWYLRAWCHSRNALRTFRADRIDAIRMTSTPVSGAATDTDLGDELFDSSPDDLVVVLELPHEALGLIADYRPENVTAANASGNVRCSIRVQHFHGLKRLVASMANTARVIEPAAASEAVAHWARTGAAQY